LERLLAFDIWHLKIDVWSYIRRLNSTFEVIYDVWFSTFYIWKLTFEVWHSTLDVYKMKISHDRGFICKTYLFFSNSYAGKLFFDKHGIRRRVYSNIVINISSALYNTIFLGQVWINQRFG
jgi:hypothetical protein